MRHVGFVFLVTAAAHAGCGSSSDCTDLGCNPTTLVQVVLEASGTYDIAVSVDAGALRHCVVEIDSSGSMGTPVCDEGTYLVAEPLDGGVAVGLVLNGDLSEAALNLTVVRDGTEVTDGQASYVETRRTGCDAACRIEVFRVAL